MGTKNCPGKFDCYANAEPDEPMFVLLGRDESAADLVDEWADWREEEINLGLKPESDRAMVVEARSCAMHMRHYCLMRKARRA